MPLDRGRIVFFYIDDLHMDLSGIQAAKKVISSFIEKEMGQNDQAAIASASGQIGFLQQLTNDRMVLRMALDRLRVKTIPRAITRPPMSEYEAELIERYDRDVLDVFITETMRLNPGITRDSAEQMVTARASSTVLRCSSKPELADTSRGADQNSQNLPGRKVVFLLSGGFLIRNRNAISSETARHH